MIGPPPANVSAFYFGGAYFLSRDLAKKIFMRDIERTSNYIIYVCDLGGSERHGHRVQRNYSVLSLALALMSDSVETLLIILCVLIPPHYRARPARMSTSGASWIMCGKKNRTFELRCWRNGATWKRWTRKATNDDKKKLKKIGCGKKQLSVNFESLRCRKG